MKCRYCKQDFEKTDLLRRMPNVCRSNECIKAFFNEYKKPFLSQVKKETTKRIKAEEREKKKKAKEQLKTHGEWLKDLQRVFNTYIRLRDSNEPCISCGKYSKHYDASHYWSVGGYPGLRFNEANCHKSCVTCNQHLHGNIAEYTPRLIAKIGQAEFDKLQSDRHKENKLNISEIKELIETYNQKIKSL